MGIRTVLRADAQAALGSTNLVRVLCALVYNPGLLCVVLYRLSAWFDDKGAVGKLLSILIWRINVFVTGAYLHPRALIGPGLLLPHPVGVIVGAGVRLGANVMLYQNTTIGVSSHSKLDLYPLVGDNVVLYCGAVIIGSTRIGSNAVIGANAVVTKDVPESTTVVGVPARVL